MLMNGWGSNMCIRKIKIIENERIENLEKDVNEFLAKMGLAIDVIDIQCRICDHRLYSSYTGDETVINAYYCIIYYTEHITDK